MFIIIVYYIIFAVTFIYGLYFLVTGAIGIIRKPRIKFNNSKNYNNFAILIAARNEEKVIGNLIESLNRLNYPKDNYNIYVIPNNCTDSTESIAKEKGANVIKCTVKTKTKGEVLKFAFNKLKKNKNIDAYVIFDADNVVHPEFLNKMNKALNSGYRVAQSFRDAKNPSDNWLSGSYTLFYLIQNVFFNHARMTFNGSSSINGTGFMIKKSYIDEVGFNTYSLTEDVEFTGQCALNKEKIVFVEDAITYDEYPVKFASSWKQRKRWTAGMLTCMKLYSPKLFMDYLKTGNIASLDMSLTYIAPIIQILNFINLIMLIVFSILGIKLYDIFSFFYATRWVYFAIAYLLGILVEIFVLLYKHKSPAKVFSGVLLFIVFIFTWIPINIICLVKKHTTWEEIKHNANVKINDIIE